MKDVRVYDKDFIQLDLPKIKWLEFSPSPPNAKVSEEEFGNRTVIISAEKGRRSIDVRFSVPLGGLMYYELIRDEYFHIFDPTKIFHFIDFSAAAKVWLVRVDELRVIQKNNRFAEFGLRLQTINTPYAFSKGTTLDEFTYDAELWGYGMGLIYDEGTQDYIHNTSSFSIYNAGNQTVDPRESELVIRLKSLGGTATTITLTNTTTIDTWSYTGGLSNGQEIVLDGVKMTKNAANIVGDTNYGLITLKAGTNQFTLSGITGAFEISFEFRYLYA